MKCFRQFLAAFVLTVSTTAFANSNANFGERWEPISFQIEKMLSDSNLVIEEDFTVTVIFKVNAERKIEIRLIDSPNEEVNQFLKKRLENQKLYGNSWDAEKIYELPVKVQATR
ncbi:hypothetical protein [Salinimicrobium sp. HB62]|uniref:hypothetical protein n=1 Tax=Salinimicrobium sp. HB62 TaxID=3077781 RepID=UPI002D7A0303|nr:hypothetical protein [Salinimicrobium sp. HB62]